MAIDWTSNGSIFDSSFKDAYIQLPASQDNGGISSIFKGGASLLSSFLPAGGSPLGVIGSQLLGGLFSGSSKVENNQSKSNSGTALDTSGTVIGEGDAEGGNIISSQLSGINDLYWISGAFLIIGFLAYQNRAS